MQHDSIEALLSRHYGSTAPVPADLEAQLCASMRQQATELEAEQHFVTFFSQKRISRRRATFLVALGTAGVGALSVGLEGLQALENALVGPQDGAKPAYS